MSQFFYCREVNDLEINKKDVIRLLEKIALYLELKGENPFRISAYRKAAQALERDVRSLGEIDQLTSVPSIGKGTAELINEYIETGESSTLLNLQQEVPEGLIPLLKVPGLGGKRLATLYKELNVTDANTLRTVCEDHSIKSIRGFGDKTIQNIVQGLDQLGARPERLPIATMLPVAEAIEQYLASIEEIKQFSLAGSLRRLEETVKDIDFIIVPTDGEAVREKLISYPQVTEIIANGETKISVTVMGEYAINIDFRLVNEEEFATTLHHFTGSKDHNVMMRQLAKKRNEKINEYGVVEEKTGKVLHFRTEKDFFKHFDVTYIPPELRAGKDEIERFQREVPIFERSHILGDLHMHTTWSDGAQSLEEMAERARALGYEYIAITDHGKFLKVANGLTETRLRKQREEIERLNEKYDDFTIFAGVEMDILPDGTLDYTNNFLQEMDIVIAAIHSSFDQTEEQIMKRLFTALENPYIDIIAHPTGRLIGRRDGYRVNVEELIEKAKDTNTALELNANPMRFDLAPKWLALSQEAGVPIAINTDAHSFDMLEHMAYGVKVANKAMLKRENVLNTWDTSSVQTFITRNN